MRTDFLHSQHTKCALILEMIQKCQSYLYRAERDLQEYRDTPMNIRWQKYLFANETRLVDGVEKYKVIRDRLEGYYHNTVNRIIRQIEKLSHETN